MPSVATCEVKNATVVRKAMLPRPSAPRTRAVINTLTNENSATPMLVA
jgi:hypothetical protein